jgi:hypothetical protein
VSGANLRNDCFELLGRPLDRRFSISGQETTRMNIRTPTNQATPDANPEAVKANLRAYLSQTAKIIHGEQLTFNNQDGKVICGYGDQRRLIDSKLRLIVGYEYARIGFMSWQGTKPAYRLRVLREGPPPTIDEMPDRDQSQWPCAKSGKKLPYDPWGAVVLLTAFNDLGDVFTIQISDWRSRAEFQTLGHHYFDRGADECPIIELQMATDVLGPTRQVWYMGMPVVGWEPRNNFVSLLKAAKIEITSVNQKPAPKTPASSAPPDNGDDDWHQGRESDFRD